MASPEIKFHSWLTDSASWCGQKPVPRKKTTHVPLLIKTDIDDDDGDSGENAAAKQHSLEVHLSEENNLICYAQELCCLSSLGK